MRYVDTTEAPPILICAEGHERIVGFGKTCPLCDERAAHGKTITEHRACDRELDKLLDDNYDLEQVRGSAASAWLEQAIAGPEDAAAIPLLELLNPLAAKRVRERVETKTDRPAGTERPEETICSPR